MFKRQIESTTNIAKRIKNYMEKHKNLQPNTSTNNNTKKMQPNTLIYYKKNINDNKYKEMTDLIPILTKEIATKIYKNKNYTKNSIIERLQYLFDKDLFNRLLYKESYTKEELKNYIINTKIYKYVSKQFVNNIFLLFFNNLFDNDNFLITLCRAFNLNLVNNTEYVLK